MVITKALDNAVMQTPRFRNKSQKFLGDKSQTNRENHKTQRNVLKKYGENINIKYIIAALMIIKSVMIEPPVKQLSLFSQRNALKKILLLCTMEKIFPMIENFTKHLATSFQTFFPI